MANVNHYKKEILEICQNWHWTAEDIYKKIKKYNIFLWIWTVYRNLTELVNEWELMRHHWLGDKLLYEKAKPIHWHLFCQNTGMIVDIDMSMIDFSNLKIPNEFCMSEIQLTIGWHFEWTCSAYCKINGKVLR